MDLVLRQEEYHVLLPFAFQEVHVVLGDEKGLRLT